MVHHRRVSISNQSTTGSEYYTPYHGYYTRLSARQSTLHHTPLTFTEAGGDPQNGSLVLEESESHSDQFSIASSYCFRGLSDTLTELENKETYENQLQKELVRYQRPMDCDGPPCNNGKRKWFKNGGIVLVVAVVGWYINNVRIQLSDLKHNIEAADSRIADIADARLDTLHKLSEVSNMLHDLRQNQANYRQTIQNIIEQEIDKIYTDKTGRTDFALESAGGRIVKLSPGTENYGPPKSSLLGFSLCDGMHGPRAMIQTGTSPGECWAFKGSNGGVIVKLLGPIKIDAVSMEHISKNISPSGDSTTAPKDFTVWGLKSLTDRGALLGQFTYNIDGSLVQTFNLQQPTHDSFDFVELRVSSNHGNSDFTCVYRFRVHGAMDQLKLK
ncbi:SUN domain-containing protein 3-like [Anthonomus grandis grandis]|uniref:SUN domain-containing protein 3-like n=1 Tax=Anthonomus grandis grandis TaxID=2921223 RepID=UPI00216568C3|nr:SUN domain-containing protein 3-like [Anthonomus grandis grandis]